MHNDQLWINYAQMFPVIIRVSRYYANVSRHFAKKKSFFSVTKMSSIGFRSRERKPMTNTKYLIRLMRGNYKDAKRHLKGM